MEGEGVVNAGKFQLAANLRCKDNYVMRLYLTRTFSAINFANKTCSGRSDDNIYGWGSRTGTFFLLYFTVTVASIITIEYDKIGIFSPGYWNLFLPNCAVETTFKIFDETLGGFF